MIRHYWLDCQLSLIAFFYAAGIYAYASLITALALCRLRCHAAMLRLFCLLRYALIFAADATFRRHAFRYLALPLC